METLDGHSTSSFPMSPPLPPEILSPLSLSQAEHLNACTSKQLAFHAFSEMGRTGEIGGSGFESTRLPKRLFSLGRSNKEPSQDQIRYVSVNKLATPWMERTPIGQHVSNTQIDWLHIPNNCANPLSTDHLLLDSQPLCAIPAGHIHENTILPHTSLDSGKGVFVSQSGMPTNPLANWSNNSSTHDIGTSIQNPLKRVRNNFDAEAATNISMALYPVKNHDRDKDSVIPMVGYLMPKVKVEPTSLSYNGQNDSCTRSHALTKQEPVEDVHSVDQPQSQTIVPFRVASERSVSGQIRECMRGRIRRARVTEGVKALQNSVPLSNKGNKESVVDDVIDYIKFLKLQLKVLSQSRLCGESTTHPFVYLEGYGHYLLGPRMCSEPLEEVLGQLMETNMPAANELLRSKGLTMLPMHLAYTLLPTS